MIIQNALVLHPTFSLWIGSQIVRCLTPPTLLTFNYELWSITSRLIAALLLTNKYHKHLSLYYELSPIFFRLTYLYLPHSYWAPFVRTEKSFCPCTQLPETQTMSFRAPWEMPVTINWEKLFFLTNEQSLKTEPAKTSSQLFYNSNKRFLSDASIRSKRQKTMAFSRVGLAIHTWRRSVLHKLEYISWGLYFCITMPYKYWIGYKSERSA